MFLQLKEIRMQYMDHLNMPTEANTSVSGIQMARDMGLVNLQLQTAQFM